jgi:hypothetical protein
MDLQKNKGKSKKKKAQGAAAKEREYDPEQGLFIVYGDNWYERNLGSQSYVQSSK